MPSSKFSSWQKSWPSDLVKFVCFIWTKLYDTSIATYNHCDPVGGQTCALYYAHQRLTPVTAGGWRAGVGECVWGQAKRSPEYSDIPISCPVSSGLKKLFWTVSWVRYTHQCAHTQTHMHPHRHITVVLTELICFHLPSVSSTLVFAVWKIS